MNNLVALFSFILILSCSTLETIHPKLVCEAGLIYENTTNTCQSECAKTSDCKQGLICNQNQNICFDPLVLKAKIRKKNEIHIKQVMNALTLIKIPGGSFMMGSNDSDITKPRHRVQVETFYLSKTEITVEQYLICVKAGVCSVPNVENGCHWGYESRKHYPINCVDWDQARKFTQWLGGDLPTEAQWEYAARSAGKDFKYAWGNDESSQKYIKLKHHWSTRSNVVCSEPKANTEQGLCDMSGNVYEWTRDGWQSHYHNAPTNASDICNTAICKQSIYRVSRGGGWYHGSKRNLRTTERVADARLGRYRDLGFRVLIFDRKKTND